jgi:hypothetical protein
MVLFNNHHIKKNFTVLSLFVNGSIAHHQINLYNITKYENQETLIYKNPLNPWTLCEEEPSFKKRQEDFLKNITYLQNQFKKSKCKKIYYGRLYFFNILKIIDDKNYGHMLKTLLDHKINYGMIMYAPVIGWESQGFSFSNDLSLLGLPLYNGCICLDSIILKPMALENIYTTWVDLDEEKNPQKIMLSCLNNQWASIFKECFNDQHIINLSVQKYNNRALFFVDGTQSFITKKVTEGGIQGIHHNQEVSAMIIFDFAHKKILLMAYQMKLKDPQDHISFIKKNYIELLRAFMWEDNLLKDYKFFSFKNHWGPYEESLYGKPLFSMNQKEFNENILQIAHQEFHMQYASKKLGGFLSIITFLLLVGFVYNIFLGFFPKEIF